MLYEVITTVSTAGSETPRRDIPRAQDQLFGQGGARAKYSALVVGRPGLAALIAYELVVLLTQAVPGALGLLHRGEAGMDGGARLVDVQRVGSYNFV